MHMLLAYRILHLRMVSAPSDSSDLQSSGILYLLVLSLRAKKRFTIQIRRNFSSINGYGGKRAVLGAKAYYFKD